MPNAIQSREIEGKGAIFKSRDERERQVEKSASSQKVENCDFITLSHAGMYVHVRYTHKTQKSVTRTVHIATVSGGLLSQQRSLLYRVHKQ